MTEQREGMSETAQDKTGRSDESQATDDRDELEAEQESAAAMDADVPQPPGADQTTEGQPS
ncbi:MAG TPA: hypothetical protein VIW80_06065 [Pyrinomonadaceae bacterium]|jgi:hypothetical protein